MLKTKAEINDLVLAIISKNIFEDEGEGEVTTEYKEDEFDISGISSLKFINIVVELESQLEFEFEDDYLDNRKFETIEDILTYVYERLNLTEKS